ncbi:hypothetical protein AAHH87_00590 [Candidatus Hodgkinia cicadicola]
MQANIVLELTAFEAPAQLKLKAWCCGLVLGGSWGSVVLSEDGFAVFLKRNRLLVCYDCKCYAVSKLANAAKGAVCGHIRWLRLNGIGYKALEAATGLSLSLGLSHKLKMALPGCVEASVVKANKLKLKSSYLDVVASAASAIKLKRPPDVYKAKGVLERKPRICTKAW